MAVCARCLGIYAGFLAGTFVYPLRSLESTHLPRPRTFIVFTLPIALDTVGNLLALWHTPSLVRLALGIFWGLLLPSYVIPALVDILGRFPRIFRLK